MNYQNIFKNQKKEHKNVLKRAFVRFFHKKLTNSFKSDSALTLIIIAFLQTS